MADGHTMFELDLFFAEQQRIMNQPSEDMSDYLMRRQRRSRTSGSHSFDTHIIGDDNASEPHSPVEESTSHGRTTSASQIADSTVCRKEPSDTHRRYVETSRGRESSPVECLSVSRASASPVANSPPVPGSKRLSEEPDPNPRALKKPRNGGEGFIAAAHTASGEPSTPDIPKRARSKRLTSSPPLRLSEVAGSGAISPDDHAPAGVQGVTLDTRLPHSSADHPASSELFEHASGACHNSKPPAPHSPEQEPVNRTPGLPAPHQRNAVRYEPEQPASMEKPVSIAPPAPASRRRSTLADCSDITSPPNSAPVAATPSTLLEKGSASAAAPRAARNTSKREPPKPVKGKGRKKEKELITPLEYARKLQAQFSAQAAGRKKHADKPFLQGKCIFYHGGDLNYAGAQTRNRMEIITRHGGTLVPKYEPTEITHIVTDADERVFLRAVGLKKLADIPQHIPTVKWSWVLSGFDRAPVRRLADDGGKGKAPEKAAGQDPGNDDLGEFEYPMDHEFQHASFRARIDAGRTPWGEAARLKAERTAPNKTSADIVQRRVGAVVGAGAAEKSHNADDISNISDFTQDIELPARDAATILPREGLPSPPSSPGRPRAGPAGGKALEPSTRAAHAAQPSSRNPAANERASGSGEPAKRAPPTTADPLAEFYASARAEREAEMFQDAGPGRAGPRQAPPGDAPKPGRREVVKKGFLCDDKDGTGMLDACPNQDVIDKLQELKALHQVKPSKDNEWRVLGYNKAISALRKHPTRIKSYDEAVAIRGVGEKTAQKIMEIIETGGLRRIEHERTEDVAAVQAFLGIYGVGTSTALKWYNSGCRNLEDVAARKGGIKLTTEQEIGLKYYEDINTRIPRAEVAEIYEKVKAAALKIDPLLFIEVMGSYRRGKPDCGDIDVLITRPTEDGKTHQGVLRRLLAQLHRQGVVTEDLCLPDDFDDLELVYRGLCRKDSSGLRRRIDFLTVPWKSRGAALLYYTGDDIFNRSLRLKANKMGYSLNQRGLYAGVIRNPSDKRQRLHDGHIVASETEEEILNILGVPWQEPHERVRG